MRTRAWSVAVVRWLGGLVVASGCQMGTAPEAVESRGDAPRDSGLPTDILRDSARLSGLVLDTRGNRVSGAAVHMGALTAETDERGAFIFDQVQADPHGTLVVTRNGFSTGRVPVAVRDEAPNHVRVTLQRAERVMLGNPLEGGEISSESGVTVKLAGGEVVDEDGNPVTTPVEVMIALLNDRDEITAAPGGMVAIDPEADENAPPAQLESFGMVEVSLTSEGRPVQLKQDARVELEFPLPNQHSFDQGDTVGLWNFDEQEEIWKNEGEGTVVADDKFKALVSHFSWWNADQVLTKTCIVGRVLDASGAPVPSAHITAEGRSYLGHSHTTSDMSGDFCVEARVSSVVDLSTLVRVGDAEQALAVRVNTPRSVASCEQPAACYVLPQELVAVADEPICDPAQCPPDPEGQKEACCISDLGPCSYVVAGDCGGSEDGSWEEPTDEPGLEAIPGVPMPPPPSTIDAGPSTTSDGGAITMDASVDAGTDSGSDTANGGTGGTGGSDETGGTGGTAGSDSVTDSGTADAAPTADGGPSDAGSCGPAFTTECMQCVMQNCDSQATGCFGDDWQQGIAVAPCTDYLACVCNLQSTDMEQCETAELVTAECSECMGPMMACADTLCSSACGSSGTTDAGTTGGSGGTDPQLDSGVDGGSSEDGGSIATPVDRCNDVTPLASGGTIEDTTVGSSLLNDWYDDGRCEAYLPGYERTYSIEVPAGQTLRARVEGAGMTVLIASSCSDIDATCILHGSSASWTNYGDGAVTMLITVDNEAVDTQAPFTLYLSTSAPACGDGFVDEGESCDDGDLEAADGCDAYCQVEAGYACTGAPSVCTLRPAGDLCSQPLSLSVGDYDLSNFNPDYYYASGPDMVFQTSVPEGQILVIDAGAAFAGRLVVTRAGECEYGRFREFWFAPGSFQIGIDPAELSESTDEAPPQNLSVIVVLDEAVSGTTFSISGVSTVTPVCGDLVLSPGRGEQCDDGGTQIGDGCDASCQIEPGFVCPPTGSCREVVCNDGLVDWPLEDCEDGNTNPGDACGSDCRTEPGYLCDWDTDTCELRQSGDLCNNAEVLPTGPVDNSYDFANMTPDVLGCSECGVSRWFSVAQQPGDLTSLFMTADFEGRVALVTQACPLWNDPMPATDGIWPGYMTSAHSINDTGAVRTLWIGVQVDPWSTPATFHMQLKTGPQGCGDGQRASGNDPAGGEPSGSAEECDDLNNVNGDGCSADCQLEWGPFNCPYEGPCWPITCGDGSVDRVSNAPYEECDDGGNLDADGCSATCTVEAGALCSGSPSQCQATSAGDVCSNALALPLGSSNHAIDAYNPDVDCLDVCSGNDVWFSYVLQPREVLDLTVTADFDGYVRLFGSDAGDCRAAYPTHSDIFGYQIPGLVQADNPTNSPITVFAVVLASYATSGAFTLDASAGVPTEDCSSGTCVAVVCGDQLINGNEQCDDGGTTSGNGCSAACVVEPGFACTGMPSTCQSLPEGDTCEIALPLADGAYGLTGYTQDGTCNPTCSSPTRWFRIDVPGGQTLALDLSTADIASGQAWMFDLSAGPCHRLDGAMNHLMFDASQPRLWTWVNLSFETVPIAIALADTGSNPSTGSFSIAHSVEPTGCGDGFVDVYGMRGPEEACDDGGAQVGDGCSSTCQVESGWDCSQGPCQPVVCGDGLVGGAEECDDGGTASGNGCSDMCMAEPGYLCDGQSPSTCQPYQSGDLCENAEAIADGNYGLTGYLPDLPCDNVCAGADRWFSLTVPAGQTFSMRLSSSDLLSGSVGIYDTSAGCGMLNALASQGIQDGTAALSGVNYDTVAHELRVVVMDWNDTSFSSFSIAHTVRTAGCGDGHVDEYGDYGVAEQCDDGNTADADGCSSTCAIEPGYECWESPSTCVLPPPGDTCTTAEPLASGSYGLAGYLADTNCTELCGGVDRWFTTAVPSGQMLRIDLSTDADTAQLNLVELPSGTCDNMVTLGADWFGSATPLRRYWGNRGTFEALLGVVLMDPYDNPSMAGFVVDSEVFVPYCGDGYVDAMGEFGAAEQCDDNNNLPGDGCSEACTWE